MYFRTRVQLPAPPPFDSPAKSSGVPSEAHRAESRGTLSSVPDQHFVYIIYGEGQPYPPQGDAPLLRNRGGRPRAERERAVLLVIRCSSVRNSTDLAGLGMHSDGMNASALSSFTSGGYGSLQKYLTARYADAVVLTFAQIEDLLGFPLPDAARAEPGWWAPAASGTVSSAQAQSWTLAKRTATPNLYAETVLFERS